MQPRSGSETPQQLSTQQRAKKASLTLLSKTLVKFFRMRSNMTPFSSRGERSGFGGFAWGDRDMEQEGRGRERERERERISRERQYLTPTPPMIGPTFPGEFGYTGRLPPSGRTSPNGRVSPSPPGGAGGVAPMNTFFESPTITLLAGPHRRRFWAHKDVLCAVPFFRAALENNFLESHTNIIELPDDDADAVGCMVSFLYSEEYFPRIIRSPQSTRSLEPLAGGVPHSRSLHIQVHVIAEKYDIPLLREVAFRKIFLVDAVDVVFIDFLREVYTHTPPSSKLRYGNRMEEYWVFGLHERIKEMRRTCPIELDAFLGESPEFARDLIKSLSYAVDCALDMEGRRLEHGSGSRGSGQGASTDRTRVS